MSVQLDRGGWLVRWRDGSGRQRGKRFDSQDAAAAFDDALRLVAPAERSRDRGSRAGGIYPYPTKAGMRWYFKARGSDGVQITKRGFASERAARDAKRRLTEQVERGEVRHTKRVLRRALGPLACAAQAIPGAGYVAGLRDRWA